MPEQVLEGWLGAYRIHASGQGLPWPYQAGFTHVALFDSPEKLSWIGGRDVIDELARLHGTHVRITIEALEPAEGGGER